MARRRLTLFHYQDVVARLRRREGRRLIAAALRVGPGKIRQIRQIAEREGWLDEETELPTHEEILAALEARKRPEGPSPAHVSVVEPHRDQVEVWLEQGMEIKTIHAALQRNHGFEGSYSAVRRFVRKLQPLTPEPTVRLQHAPGDIAQVDFGSGPKFVHPETGKERRTHVFVMTLAYSRHQYAEVVWDQGVATWLGCHRNAFEFWEGVVDKVVCDNLRSAITKACSRDPLVQRSYGEFAMAYGFIISPCVVRTPKHKGIVENGVRYLKRSFFNSPRTFRNINDCNQQLLEWILGEAGNRVHGTTQRPPLELFAEKEKAALKPLPADPVELAVWREASVHPDCHVVFNKSYYSVPHRYVGERLDLRATEKTVMVFDRTEVVACHNRAHRPGQWRTQLDHLPPEKTAYLRQTPVWCKKQAELVGPACAEFMTQLLGDRVTDRLRAAQGLLRLRKKHGTKRLEAACRRALAFDNVRYRTVKRILEQGLDQLSLDESEGGQLDLFADESPRFVRDFSDFFRPTNGRSH